MIRRLLPAAVVGLLVFAGPAGARTWRPWPQTPLSGAQLSASSAAAGKHGVPVNIVRGVATYKDGPAVSSADFGFEATRLEWWYRQLFPRFGGSAVVNWTRAAAAEMGQGANPLDVARATANQQVAISTILTGPFWAAVATLLPGAASVGAAGPGEVGIGGAGTGAAAPGAGAAGTGAAPLKPPSLPRPQTPEPAADTAAGATSAPALAALAGAATLFIADHVGSDTHADVLGGWFRPLYSAIEDYAWLLAVVAIAMSGLLIAIRGKGADVATVVRQVPYAALMMVAVPVLVTLAMTISNAMAGGLMHRFPDGSHLLHVMAGTLGGIAGSSVVAHMFGFTRFARFTASGGWWIGMFGLLGAGMIALELIVREIIVYLAVVIVPLALIAGLFAPLAKWSYRLFSLLLVVIFSNFLIALGLVMVGLMMMSGITDFSPIRVIVAFVALLLLAFVPMAVWGGLVRIGNTRNLQASRRVRGPRRMPPSPVRP